MRAIFGWLILKVLWGLESLLFLGPRLSDRWLLFLEKYEPWKTAFSCDVLQCCEGDHEAVLEACRGPSGDEQAQYIMQMVNEHDAQNEIKAIAMDNDVWIDQALPGECIGVAAWPRDEDVLLALRDCCDAHKVNAEIVHVHPPAVGLWVERAILILHRRAAGHA